MRVHLGDALWFKAREALRLPSEPAASVATWQDLVARFLYQLLAFDVFANISKRWPIIQVQVIQLLKAEAAGGLVDVLASFSQVVWGGTAFGAEILLARVASDSVVCHVGGGLEGKEVSFVIFLAEVDISWNEIDDVPAITLEHVFAGRKQLLRHLVLDALPLLRSDILLELIVIDHQIAGWAFERVKLASFLEDSISEAIDMSIMKTV